VDRPSDIDDQVCLRGAGLVLRRWRPGDEPALLRELADLDIERYMSRIPFPYLEADAREWVQDLAPAGWASGGVELALDLGDGVPVGSLGIHREERQDGPVGVVGYWVAAPVRRRGLAGQALRLVAPWAADRLGLPRLELIHDVDNVASCRTALRSGFGVDAVLVGGDVRRDGSPRDVERHTWSTPDR
jgi:ribosomal-protein-alanine N-acetyltransferase